MIGLRRLRSRGLPGYVELLSAGGFSCSDFSTHFGGGGGGRRGRAGWGAVGADGLGFRVALIIHKWT